VRFHIIRLSYRPGQCGRLTRRVRTQSRSRRRRPGGVRAVPGAPQPDLRGRGRRHLRTAVRRGQGRRGDHRRPAVTRTRAVAGFITPPHRGIGEDVFDVAAQLGHRSGALFLSIPGVGVDRVVLQADRVYDMQTRAEPSAEVHGNEQGARWRGRGLVRRSASAPWPVRGRCDWSPCPPGWSPG
jgi:hypothetical protein